MSVSRGRRRCRVLVLMVLVVFVPVDMLQRLMNMLVLMPFREMQPDASSHEQAGGNKRERERLA
jgi:hypothetical protein